MPDTITGQPECIDCGGACCQPDRLEFPVADGTTMQTADLELEAIGLSYARALEVRVNEHGRTVVRTECYRPWWGLCEEQTRPDPCLRFPLSYLDADHSDAERAEVAEFCALLRRLIEEAQSDPS